MTFGAQFTSVVLILLTFLIGAMLRPSDVISAEKKAVEQEVILPIGKKSYSKLFLKDQAILNEEEALAIKTFLMQHDIFAKISLYDQDESLLLARSVVLQRYLDDIKLPLDARKVYTYLQSKPIQAEIVFSFSKESDGLI